jgi:hypothetical protein
MLNVLGQTAIYAGGGVICLEEYVTFAFDTTSLNKLIK